MFFDAGSTDTFVVAPTRQRCSLACLLQYLLWAIPTMTSSGARSGVIIALTYICHAVARVKLFTSDSRSWVLQSFARSVIAAGVGVIAVVPYTFVLAGCCDEAMGLEATVEPWKAKLWPALKVHRKCVCYH
jgi:hypothetical protein